MKKKILVINGSPHKKGNTSFLVEWFMEGARGRDAEVAEVRAAFLKAKHPGCTSCRKCQVAGAYGCVIVDEVSPVLLKMIEADVIVMASPLYFFAASAQLKIIMDRMFSLYKWDNASGAFETPLKGKTFALIGSAYESTGMDVFEAPFAVTAEYTGMTYRSLLVPNAGVSGDICGRSGIRERAVAFGREIAEGKK